MLKFIFILILFLFPPFYSQCREIDTLFYSGSYSINVDSIIAEGYKITKPDVITRELTFGKGDTVTPGILKYNSDRIFSLGIFTRVNITAYRANQCNYVLISVDESWYIYPLPFASFQNRDWQQISYGINFLLKNFRGENETLSAVASFGDDPNFTLSYIRPYIIRDQNIYLTVQLSYENAINKSTFAEELFGGNFNQKFINGSIDFGKRLNLFNKVDLFSGYNYVDNPFFIKGISASNARIDRQIYIGSSYTYDTRDLAQFPGKGAYAYANIQFNGLGINYIDYQVANIDLRKYFKLDSVMILKFRAASRLTFGRLVPFYDYSYFGYAERIRGYYNQEMEGNDSYVGSAELDYPVIKFVNISFDYLPVIPKSLLSCRFAMYAELFCDSGVTRLWGQTLDIDDLDTGYGAGFIFLLLPYNQLTIEYAINNYGRTQIIFGLGTSF